jgi:hypothetical protein
MAMAGQRILEAASSLCGGDNMENLNFAERLYSELIDEGLVIVGVSIGNESDTSTWTVQPQSKQSSAQPFIDAVNTSQWTIDANYDTLRTERDVRLTDCDWTQVTDTQLSEAEVSAWQVYRQQLRDLPATVANPANPSWPIPPAS